MSVTRHLIVILPPFSRPSVGTFPKLFHQNSAFKCLFLKAFKTCYNSTVFFLFSHKPNEGCRGWSTASVHGCQKKRGRCKCLRLSMHCIYSSVFLSECFEAREIPFMEKHIQYPVFVSLNVIQLAERKREIFHNFTLIFYA
jgi:hypothetical protein